MKKYYFLLISLLFVFTIHAQKFNGGVMLGFTGSQVAGDNDSGYNKAGLFGGGFVNLEIGSRSLLQLELEFMQKGSRHNPNFEQGDTKSLLIRPNYGEMPLLLQ
ncbi:MAG: PorT family protein [Bacteroidales bacterium]|nr:PorT family protein [Bacteroidales bacterium]